MENEIWRDIPGFERYQVSSLGRVKSLRKTVTIMSPSKSSRYCQVTLYKNGKRHYRKVHRLVAEAFIPNPDNLPCVNHKNEDKTDNRVDNLEWCDAKYNNNYGYRSMKMAQSLSGKDIPLKYKAIEQLDLDGNIVRTYQAIKQVADYGYNQSTICNCCKRKTKTAYGFYWRYKEKAG